MAASIEGNPIRPAGQVAAILLERGVMSQPLHPAALLRAADLFSLRAPFVLRGGADRSSVVATSHILRYDRTLRTARQAARRCGILAIKDVASALPRAAVALALHRETGIVVQRQWCWQVPDRSEIGRVICRVLTAAGGPLRTRTSSPPSPEPRATTRQRSSASPPTFSTHIWRRSHSSARRQKT